MVRDFDLKKYLADEAIILVRMKRFQKEVVNFRRAIGIPETGLPIDARANWYQSQFLAPDVDTHRIFSLEANQEFLPPNKHFIEELERFAGKFNLDERWYSHLFIYLTSGDGHLDPPDSSISFRIRVNDARLPEDQIVVTHFSIVFSKDTRLGDIKKAWNRIKKWQAKMKTRVTERRRPVVNVRTYLKIRDLEDQGKSQNEIADMVFKNKDKTSTDVASFKYEIEERFRSEK